MPRRDTRLFRRKGSPYWFGRLPDGQGGYARKSLKTQEYKVARARLKEWEAQLGARPDRPANSSTSMTVADALVECEYWHRDRVKQRKDYIERHGWARAKKRPPGCSEATLEIFVKKARHLARLLADLPLSTLDPDDVQAYIETRRREAACSNTISKELIELRKTLKLALRQRHVLSGPVEVLVPPFDPEYQPKTTVLPRAG